MNNKNVGLILLLIGIVFGIVMLTINSLVSSSLDAACGCNGIK